MAPLLSKSNKVLSADGCSQDAYDGIGQVPPNMAIQRQQQLTAKISHLDLLTGG